MTPKRLKEIQKGIGPEGTAAAALAHGKARRLGRGWLERAARDLLAEVERQQTQGNPQWLLDLLPRMKRCASADEAWNLLNDVMVGMGGCRRCRSSGFLLQEAGWDRSGELTCVECPECRGRGENPGSGKLTV